MESRVQGTSDGRLVGVGEPYSSFASNQHLDDREDFLRRAEQRNNEPASNKDHNSTKAAKEYQTSTFGQIQVDVVKYNYNTNQNNN